MDKKGLKFFMKRVVKLDNMRSVSRREHKLIRKLLRGSKKSEVIDWEAILFHFPGKRLEYLKSYTIENFPKYFQNINMSEFLGSLDGSSNQQNANDVENSDV